VLRVHRIPHSTNVERVALACGLKGVEVHWVDHDPSDRSGIRAVSGQDLVPVLEADGEVVTDSPRILRWLDARYPEPSLFPEADDGFREVEAFVDFFNQVWKAPPNRIHAELARPEADQERVATWSEQMAAWLPGIDALLDGRDFLFGDAATAADLAAFPFLKFGVIPLPPDDTDRFHRILAERLRIAGRYPRLEAWVRRIDAFPRE
jgi:glutathione S-transferase